MHLEMVVMNHTWEPRDTGFAFAMKVYNAEYAKRRKAELDASGSISSNNRYLFYDYYSMELCYDP